MAKPGGERKERKRFTQPLSEPERALAKDAAAQARQLKRKHRALYTTDPRRFRKIERLAQSVVFRQNQDRSPTKKLPGVSLILPVARNGVNAPRSATIAPNGPVLAPGPPGPLPGLDEFDEFELDESEEVDEPERED